MSEPLKKIASISVPGKTDDFRWALDVALNGKYSLVINREPDVYGNPHAELWIATKEIPTPYDMGLFIDGLVQVLGAALTENKKLTERADLARATAHAPAEEMR